MKIAQGEKATVNVEWLLPARDQENVLSVRKWHPTFGQTCGVAMQDSCSEADKEQCGACMPCM